MVLPISTQTIQPLGHKVIPLEEKLTATDIRGVENEELGCVKKSLDNPNIFVRLLQYLGLVKKSSNIGVRALQYSDKVNQRYLSLTVVGRNVEERKFPDLSKSVEALGYAPVEAYNPVDEGAFRLL